MFIIFSNNPNIIFYHLSIRVITTFNVLMVFTNFSFSFVTSMFTV